MAKYTHFNHQRERGDKIENEHKKRERDDAQRQIAARIILCGSSLIYIRTHYIYSAKGAIHFPYAISISCFSSFSQQQQLPARSNRTLSAPLISTRSTICSSLCGEPHIKKNHNFNIRLKIFFFKYLNKLTTSRCLQQSILYVYIINVYLYTLIKSSFRQKSPYARAVFITAGAHAL